MPSQRKISTINDEYRNHHYTIEKHITQMRGGDNIVAEAVSGIKLYVDGRSIIPSKEFTKAEQAAQAIQAHIDKLEDQMPPYHGVIETIR